MGHACLSALCHDQATNLTPSPVSCVVAGLREDAGNEGRPARSLIYVKPEEHLDVLVERLFANEVSLAPCVSTDPRGKSTKAHLAPSFFANQVSSLPVSALILEVSQPRHT